MKFVSLTGLISYNEAREMQKLWVDLRQRDEVEDTVFFLEHAPVITRGRGLQRQPGSDGSDLRRMPDPVGTQIEICDTERGGDLTYHGPGQLVAYPIVKLKGGAAFRDVHSYLRFLELSIIDLMGAFDISARTKDGATGVWVGDRKIASIGIAVRKWITYHGIAINVVNDLSPFHAFSPCGFESEVMTSMKTLKDTVFSALALNAPGEWRRRIETSLAQSFLNCAGLDLTPRISRVAWQSADNFKFLDL